jgi:hypothetical protein
MSVQGQSRHFDGAPRTSALPRSADIADRVRQVRKVPEAEMRGPRRQRTLGGIVKHPMSRGAAIPGRYFAAALGQMLVPPTSCTMVSPSLAAA